MIELAVFDFNGTIVADTAACLAADNRVLETFGGTPVNMRTFQDGIIIPGLDFYVEHGCNRQDLLDNPQKVGDTFHDFYEPRAARLRTRKGVRSTLEQLAEQGVVSVILSNHTIEGIQAQLERLNIQEYFKAVLANSLRNSSMFGRNKMEKLQTYMEQNSYNPKNVIIVGDSPEEQEIAKKLGITGVAITEGYYSTTRLKKSNPDFMITRFDQLIGAISSVQ